MGTKREFGLLKPEVTRGYFRDEERLGQEYWYLHVPERAGKKTLDKDIAAGARQYESVKQLLDKQDKVFYDGKTNYILIEATTLEEGLTAVTYMMGEYLGGFDCQDEEEGQLGFKDTEELDAVFGADGEASDEDGLEAEDEDELNMGELSMFEDERNIPIIRSEEIGAARAAKEQGNTFGADGHLFQGNMPLFNKPPYWSQLYGSIIIVSNQYNSFYTGSSPLFTSPVSGLSSHKFDDYKLFEDRNKVFVLIINSQLERRQQEEEDEAWEDDDSQELPFGGMESSWGGDYEDYDIPRFLLEYTADHVVVKMNPKQRDAYYKKLFLSWMERYGFELERKFPTKQIIEKMQKVDEQGVSTTMEKMLKYIRHNDKDCRVLRKEHFKLLGVIQEAVRKEAKQIPTMSDLVGAEEIKEQFDRIVRNMLYGKLRKEMGMHAAQYSNVHLFVGAPGTAKTTFARILGQLMMEKKLLKGTRFKSCTGAQLKGEYVGQTAPKIHRIFNENDIIFIDEAYSIAATDMGGLDLYSQEALAQLAVELENHAQDRLVIFAGYGGMDVRQKNNKMLDFFNANPGIKSRINNTVYFKSYTPDEMVAIAHGIAGQMDMELSEDADGQIREYFKSRVKEDNFGNGREARSFVENCQMNVAYRVMELPETKRTKKMLRMITPQDVTDTLRQLRENNRTQYGNRSFGFSY